MNEIDKIIKYKELFDQGVITEREFQIAKQKIIGGESGESSNPKEKLRVLEEKQFEYIERLETITDDTRRAEITEMLASVEREIKETKELIVEVSRSIIEDDLKQKAAPKLDKNPKEQVVEELTEDQRSKDKKEETKCLLKRKQIVCVGKYPQGNDYAEDIEWIVLDTKENKALLLSKHILAKASFSETYDSSGELWDNCDLRKWLNNAFINEAFSEEEIESIVSTPLYTGENKERHIPNSNKLSTDKIFILSINEVEKYLRREQERIAESTAFAKADSNDRSLLGRIRRFFDVDGEWWLRAPGSEDILTEMIRKVYSVAFVEADGEINTNGYDMNINTVGVRPALWIECSDIVLKKRNDE